MNEKRIILTIILFFVAFCLKAQKEDYVWFLGDSLLLDFNSVSPQLNANARLQSLELCNSISDSNGVLLFYGNEDFIYDRTHSVMQNGTGMLGHKSMTQGMMTIPLPDSRNVYSVFQIGSNTSTLVLELYYSNINMNTNGGLGSVDFGIKNIPLCSSIVEKLAAVKHADGKRYWIITHGYGTNEFIIFLLTSSGISGPYYQNIGSVHPVSFGGDQGQIDISRDGNKIALVTRSGLFEIFDFDRCTGVISNPVTLNISPSGYYGCAFSPNGKKLYTSEIDNSGSDLYQYNLDSANLAASRVLIWTSPNNVNLGQLELGPDDKIYITHNRWPFAPDTSNKNLSVINSPNQDGGACNFQSYAIPTDSGKLTLSLPNYPNYRLPPLTTQPADGGLNATICPGDSAQLGVADTSGGKVIFTWSPTAGLSNPNISNPKASPSVTTTYYLTATDTTLGTSCAAFTDSVTVTVRSSVQPANAGPDQTICIGDSAQLGIPAAADVVYAWSPATGLNDPVVAQPVASPSATTTYVLTTTDTLAATGCAVYADTVTLTVEIPAQTAGAGPDLIICTGDSVMIGTPDTSGGKATFSWWPFIDMADSSAATTTVYPLATTTYYLTVTDTSLTACPATMDTVTISVEQPIQQQQAQSPFSICPDEAVEIGIASQADQTYTWSPIPGLDNPNASLTFARPDQSTIYTLTVTDTTKVTSNCRSYQSAVQVFMEDCEVEIPNVITPNGDGQNDYFVIRNIKPNTQLSIFNRWGVEIYSSGNYRNDWPVNQQLKSGVYFYVVKWEGEAKRGSFTVLR